MFNLMARGSGKASLICTRKGRYGGEGFIVEGRSDREKRQKQCGCGI